VTAAAADGGTIGVKRPNCGWKSRPAVALASAFSKKNQAALKE
jgi:hypothetical protein